MSDDHLTTTNLMENFQKNITNQFYELMCNEIINLFFHFIFLCYLSTKSSKYTNEHDLYILKYIKNINKF